MFQPTIYEHSLPKTMLRNMFICHAVAIRKNEICKKISPKSGLFHATFWRIKNEKNVVNLILTEIFFFHRELISIYWSRVLSLTP